MQLLLVLFPSDGSNTISIFSNNFSLEQHIANPAGVLSKKNIVIAVHIVQQAINAETLSPYWNKCTHAMLEIMTKQIKGINFNDNMKQIFSVPKVNFGLIWIGLQFINRYFMFSSNSNVSCDLDTNYIFMLISAFERRAVG